MSTMAQDAGKLAKMTTILNSLKEVEIHHKWCAKETFTDEKTLAVVKSLAKRGFTQTAIAQVFGMSQRTFARRLESNSHLAEAFQTGRKEGLGELMNTAYALGVSGMDPQTTRYMIDKMEKAIEHENQMMQRHEDENTIDTTARPTGALKPEEIKAIVKEAYENDPMLKEEDEND